MRELTREQARRVAIRAQLLDAERADDLVTVTERLTFLQLDPIAVVAQGGARSVPLIAGSSHDHPRRRPDAG